MSQKTLYYLAAAVGGIIGSFIPNIWGGGGLLSISSLIFSTIGGIAGIVLVWKFFQ